MTEESSLRFQVLDKVAALLTAAFGLIAALAWNEAVKALITAYTEAGSSLVALFAYALGVTLLAVGVSIWVGKALARAKPRTASEAARRGG